MEMTTRTADPRESLPPSKPSSKAFLLGISRVMLLEFRVFCTVSSGSATHNPTSVEDDPSLPLLLWSYWQRKGITSLT
jgi:hypothetical protein